MKIAPVDNTHFNGKFRNNALLEKALTSADAYDLEDFLKLLKNMERKDDGREFYLKVVPEPLCGGDYLGLYENEHLYGNRYVQIWNDRSKNTCGYILNNITRRLNNIYPPPPREKLPRENLLKEIHNKLDEM